MNLSQAKFTVDVSAYTGGLATLTLLSAPTLTAVSPSVTITGTRAGWSAVVTQDLATGMVSIRMVPPPLNSILTADKQSGPAPLTVAFDASASSAEAGIVSYDWDFGAIWFIGDSITHTVVTDIATGFMRIEVEP